MTTMTASGGDEGRNIAGSCKRQSDIQKEPNGEDRSSVHCAYAYVRVRVRFVAKLGAQHSTSTIFDKQLGT